jgi:biotin transporter BioY
VSKLKSVKRRIALAISISVVAVVVSAAVAGAIYTDLNLCYESGGRWAVSFIPTLGGEVLVCQTLVALARAGVLRLLD